MRALLANFEMLLGWPRLRGLKPDDQPHPQVEHFVRVICPSLRLAQLKRDSWDHFTWGILTVALTDGAKEIEMCKQGSPDADVRLLFRGPKGESEQTPLWDDALAGIISCIRHRARFERHENDRVSGMVDTLKPTVMDWEPSPKAACWEFDWRPGVGRLYLKVLENDAAL